MLDHLQLMDERDVNIPTFVAADLSNLPPVSFDDIDVSSLLASIEKMRAEFSVMKTAMNEQVALVRDVESVCQANSQSVKTLKPPSVVKPSKPPGTEAVGTDGANAATVAKHVGDAQEPKAELKWSDVTRRNRGPQKKKDAIIGTAKVEGIKAVTRQRKASVFVSRLSPDLDPEVLKTHIVGSVGFEVAVEKLKTRFDTYSSFHITAICQDPHKLLSPDLWPEDTYIRWFYEKKKVDARTET